MTIASLISSLRGTNKEWTTDTRITDRFIYNEAVSVRNVLLKQEEFVGRLYDLTNLFKTLVKVELIETSTIEACGIKSDCLIKRTKDPLPLVTEVAGGWLIRSVTSLDGSQSVFLTTDLSWARKLRINDKHAKNELFAFIKNKYLYLPNVQWDYIQVEAIFEDPDQVDQLNACCEENLDCTPIFEREFIIPNYLEKGLKDLLNENLLRYYHRLRFDTNPNKNPQT